MVLLIRRALTETVSVVDYGILSMALAGISGLIQSIIISLLNISWDVQANIDPCVSPHCEVLCCREAVKDPLAIGLAAAKKVGYKGDWMARRGLIGVLAHIVLINRINQFHSSVQISLSVSQISCVGSGLGVLSCMRSSEYIKHEIIAVSIIQTNSPDHKTAEIATAAPRSRKLWHNVRIPRSRFFYFLEFATIFVETCCFAFLIYSMAKETSMRKDWEITQPCSEKMIWRSACCGSEIHVKYAT
jgi:hypothetical protein